MTAYTTITDATLTAGKPGTQAVFRALRDNAIAITEGAGGAPPVQTAAIAALAITEAKLAAASVSQGKLKTTQGSGTTGGAIILLPGGEYGFHPTMSKAGNGTYVLHYTDGATFSQYGTDNSAVAALFVKGDGNGGNWQQRYVQASRPYNLGDGEIPLFIFAIMNSDGTIHSTYVAPEAPWHNNGPTSIRPDMVIGGRGFQRRREILAEFGSIKAALLSGLTRAQVLDRLATDPMVDREVTQAIKNADMPLLPHPFVGNNLTGKTAVLLDPVSPLMTRLLGVHESGESVTEVVHGWLTIGNTALVRSGPPGVMVVGANLK